MAGTKPGTDQQLAGRNQRITFYPARRLGKTAETPDPGTVHHPGAWHQ
jgi:hypothetical protein